MRHKLAAWLAALSLTAGMAAGTGFTASAAERLLMDFENGTVKNNAYFETDGRIVDHGTWGTYINLELTADHADSGNALKLTFDPSRMTNWGGALQIQLPITYENFMGGQSLRFHVYTKDQSAKGNTALQVTLHERAGEGDEMWLLKAGKPYFYAETEAFLNAGGTQGTCASDGRILLEDEKDYWIDVPFASLSSAGQEETTPTPGELDLSRIGLFRLVFLEGEVQTKEFYLDSFKLIGENLSEGLTLPTEESADASESGSESSGAESSAPTTGEPGTGPPDGEAPGGMSAGAVAAIIIAALAAAAGLLLLLKYAVRLPALNRPKNAEKKE